MLVTDYLIVGAGAASMAFVDTLLTELPNVTVIIVDKHPAPGGHWNDAYGFVRLHQPSLLYGVASKQLEGKWSSLLLRGMLPWRHRATKQEILVYYQTLMDDWVGSGRVQYFPNCAYVFPNGSSSSDDKHQNDKDGSNANIHTIVNEDTKKYQKITVRKKLVNGILGECRVPSQTPPQFPVDDGVPIRTPNDMYEEYTPRQQKGWFFSSNKIQHNNSKNNNKKYVVLGCGKTALDTVVFLQRELGVSPDNILWVISNDMWMIRRNGGGSPWSWGSALLHCNGDANKAGLYLEQQQIFARLDKGITPTKSRFAVVSDDELQTCQNIPTHNMIRRGRVQSIQRLSSNGSSQLAFVTKEAPPLIVSGEHVILHCTSPGPFNGNKVQDIFPSPTTIQLLLMYAPPVPISMSCIAAIESRLQKGTLDLDLARILLDRTESPSSSSSSSSSSSPTTTLMSDTTTVLNALIRGYTFGEGNDNVMDHIAPITTLTIVLALLDCDPLQGLKWFKSNRLSFLSIPGFRGNMVENLETMIQSHEDDDNDDALRYTKDQIQQLEFLKQKLEPLRGM